jgi:putative ABC transport system ATP-binding protein
MTGPNAGTAVAARDVVRTFRGRGEAVRAVDGVTLEVPAGGCVALTGPSGCGKSTLLALLGALDVPTSGTVALDGEDLASASESRRTAIRRGIGFAFQAAPMIAGLPLWENVSQGLVAAGVRATERRRLAAAALERVGLAGLDARRPGELSGGERQRAAVARALVAAPRLVLADEPTSQLDAESGAAVIAELVRAHRCGATVVVASHDAALLAAADVVRPMRAGRFAPTDPTAS